MYFWGDYVYDAYQPVKDETADDSLKKVIDKLTKVFVPVVSKNFGIFRFRNCKQANHSMNI